MSDPLFGEAQLGKIGRAQVRLVRAEELVELRRDLGRAGEHGVRLTTMVDPVLEDVREQAVHRLLHPAIARSIASAYIQSTVTTWLSVALIDGKKLVRGGVKSACESAAQALGSRWLAQAFWYAQAAR